VTQTHLKSHKKERKKETKLLNKKKKHD